MNWKNLLLSQIPREGEAEGAAAAAAAAAAAKQPWHNGADAETLGFWQNKGYDLTEPLKFAGAITKHYRDLEKHIGVPADKLLRIPEANAAPADIAAFHQKLGRPAEAKDYDFAGVKWGDADLPASFTDNMRNALFKANVPKSAAADIVKGVVKHFVDDEAAKATVTNARIAEEKAKLDKDWGPNKDYNLLKAMEGARRLGITPEAVKLLESQIGYADVMNAMRKIGQGTTEDAFHEGGRGPNGMATTLQGAQQQLAELEKDKDWGKRLSSGDAATVAQWRALTAQISEAA